MDSPQNHRQSQDDKTKGGITMENYIEYIRALVRPFITVSLTIAILTLTSQGQIPGRDLLQVFLIVLGFYFGHRSGKKENAN